MAEANTTTTLPSTQANHDTVLKITSDAAELSMYLARHFRKKAHELDQQIQKLEALRDEWLARADAISSFDDLGIAVMPLDPKCSAQYPEDAAMLQEFIREWPGLDGDGAWLREYDFLYSVEKLREHDSAKK